ncbi:hypothetical protein MATL_G00161440 [Megalops atlanticus]|uniref:Ig-like domain-containing protein n=1 Tax=Megalops atlanticus TaxID=7932 RepID=A0A9D3PR38_MEGAT|nr:hypothetical protein MATL_G00161440 [Megalops atlanticus]
MFILVALFLIQRGIALDQSPDVLIEKGNPVSLTCTQRNTTSTVMYWYQQRKGSAFTGGIGLQLVVFSFGSLAEIEEGFKELFKAERKDTSLFLKVDKSQPSHSAIYFCAKKSAR